MTTPRFPGPLLKNDHLFLANASGTLPFAYSYIQEQVEVVHGPSCKVENEIAVEKCRQDNVPVVKRRGGGGTVVLSPGMIVTLAVGKRKNNDSIHTIFSRIHQRLIRCIDPDGRMGIEEKGLSDLAVGNRKILGSSLYITSNPARFYYQSSLMVNADMSLMDRYLKHPPKEPDYRKGRSHAQFCTNLMDTGLSISADALCRRINECLADALREEG